MKLDGKAALVTGGAKRLGRESALALAEDGADVAVHYRNSSDEAMDVVRRVEAHGRRAVAIRADLCRSDEVTAVVNQAGDFLGRVDVLVHCASLFFRTPFGSVSDEQWEQLINVNVRAAFFLAQGVASGMKERGEGKIILFGDATTHYAVPDFAPYAVAKAGVESLTRTLAKALAPEVQVNAVLPGAILPPVDGDEKSWQAAINTNLLKRPGDPKDIVSATRYLIAEDFLTGVLLPVDGGKSSGR
jgi:pteridine reductase